MGTTLWFPSMPAHWPFCVHFMHASLEEKLALHQRAACIVNSTMAELVDAPAFIAPFGLLLVPEMQTVAANVHFVET
jgi:hypothetical protein